MGQGVSACPLAPSELRVCGPKGLGTCGEHLLWARCDRTWAQAQNPTRGSEARAPSSTVTHRFSHSCVSLRLRISLVLRSLCV